MCQADFGGVSPRLPAASRKWEVVGQFPVLFGHFLRILSQRRRVGESDPPGGGRFTVLVHSSRQSPVASGVASQRVGKSAGRRVEGAGSDVAYRCSCNRGSWNEVSPLRAIIPQRVAGAARGTRTGDSASWGRLGAVVGRGRGLTGEQSQAASREWTVGGSGHALGRVGPLFRRLRRPYGTREFFGLVSPRSTTPRTKTCPFSPRTWTRSWGPLSMGPR